MMTTDLGALASSPPTTYSTDPILEYMFDSIADAVNQAKIWGFDGYRAYLINGVIKYAPCSTSEDYQQATRLYMVQGGIVAQGQEVFGDKLVGYQYTEKDTIKGDPIFTLGNFTITTKVTEKQDAIYTLADTMRGYTAQDFTLDGIEALKSQIITDATAKIRFDKSNLEKYVTYASLRERFRVSMQEIAETFPASLHISPYSISYPCVSDYYAYQDGESASFRILISGIKNPFNIDIFKSGQTAPQPEYTAALRNFSVNYTKYELYYDNIAYQILSITAPTGSSDPNNLFITVLGNPFESVVSVNGTANVDFYIKPLRSEIDKFYNTTTELTAYLLNYASEPKYIATFNVPHRLEDGTFQIMAKSLAFPMHDAFNIDIFSSRFDDYMTDLNFTADEFDRYKTDLISRFLTSESLQEYDTEDRKAYATQQMYGHMFDNVKQYADGIAYMTRVSYDKIDNIPDVLLKNFAHTLGWKTYEIENDETLLQSLFDVTADRQGNDTPQEIDIELWRRIIINSFYLFKSKGTRKSIEFALELVGIPLEIMDINEYVYLAERSLNYGNYYSVFNSNIHNYPIDSDGYPTTPSLYFQAYGGNMLNNAQNIGPYDNGQAYMNTYRKFDTYDAFKINRVADNKKSWVKTDVTSNQYYDFMLRGTNYTIKDSRLVINSKEADAFISTQMTFDYYVYSFYRDNEYSISVSGTTVDPSILTFNEYLRDIIEKLINVRNRKVVKTYPALSKIYWDYLRYAETLGKKTIDNNKTLDFISKFDTYWVKLVQQFIPATTIFLAGKKFANSNTTRAKFQYKHGLNNAKAWLGTDGSEFQDDALKPSLVGSLLINSEGYLGQNLSSNNLYISAEGKLTPRASGIISVVGTNQTDYTGFIRHYNSQQTVLLEAHANYGTMTGLTSSAQHGLMCFPIYSGSSGCTANVGFMETVEGTYYNPQLGNGGYAGLVMTGTTGTTVIMLNSLPDTGSTYYPLHTVFMFSLYNVHVNPNEYYVMEGDIMLMGDISGNTEYSYIGLIPMATGVTSPSAYITDREMIEGCFGAVAYDTNNWVHMKTKFQTNQPHIHMGVIGHDIYYTGTTEVHLNNFSVTKYVAETDSSFIMPPPLPHTCYFDTTGTTIGGLTGNTDMLIESIFDDSGTWSVTGTPFNIDLSPVGFDYASITFDYTDPGFGVGGGGMQNISGYTEPPVAGQQYYYRFGVKIDGYQDPNRTQPKIYFDPFWDGQVTHASHPIKFQCDYNIPFSYFEGYYTPSVIPANASMAVGIYNPSKLDALNYTVQLDGLILEKVVQPFTNVLKYPNLTDWSYSGSTAWVFAGTPGGLTDTQGTLDTDDYWRVTCNYSTSGGTGTKPAIYSSAPDFYNTPFENDTLYYWKFSVAVTGSTSLTYVQQPTVHFYPIVDDNFTGTTAPVSVKGRLDQDVTTFEGYYLSGTLGANAHPQFYVTNSTALNATTGSFIIEVSRLLIQKVDLFFDDAEGNHWWYKQPHAFGYSMNLSTTQPEHAVGGSSQRWVVPYLPYDTGYTGETDDRRGMYEEYINLVTTFPLMHVPPAHVVNYEVQVEDSQIDINLTHECGLEYKFYNGINPCITPEGLTIQNILILEGMLEYTFDGFYPTTGMTAVGLGPYYTTNSVYGMYTTVGTDTITCYKGVNNLIPLLNQYGSNWEELAADTGYTSGHTVPLDFASALSSVSLANSGMRVSQYNLLKIESQLIYDCTVATTQTVIVKLIGKNGTVYDQQSFVRGGSDNPLYATLSSRIIQYTFEGYFYANDEIYLTVRPQSYECVIMSSEEIECVGGYKLSGSTGGTVSHLIADTYTNASGATSNTYFTGSTFDNRYMINEVYDVIRVHPSGVYGVATSGLTEHTDIYDRDFDYFMAYASGTSGIGGTITVSDKAADKINYPLSNSYIYAIDTQIPSSFTGVTWSTYSSGGTATTYYNEVLTGTTYSVLRKSWIKVYESTVTGTTASMEQNLIAFYKSNGVAKYKLGYSKEFFDDPITKFFYASDTLNTEVFTYGVSTLHQESDGLWLTYEFAKDAAGYPVTGEFIGRFTGKDPCGNFATIYLLLFIDLKGNSYVNRVSTNTTTSQLAVNFD